MASNSYDTSAKNGAAWLIQQRNTQDGSWGASDDTKYAVTSEAVMALGALNQLGAPYYAGQTWLQNHAVANLDFTARRMLAAGGTAGSINIDQLIFFAVMAANAAPLGNNGVGLDAIYRGSALDSSLAIEALSSAGTPTTYFNLYVVPAANFLATSQLSGSDSGWAVGQEAVSDTISTAHAIDALVSVNSRSTSSTLTTAISKGLVALNAKISVSSTVPEIAQAAIANLRDNSASSQATTQLAMLLGMQASDGSWNEDAYATALALRALAAGMGRDLAAQQQVVSMPDNNLRAAVNAALGHGAMDALNVGQLQQLTTLDASGLGITDLTGLQYATNLTSLNVSNNQINSFAPVAGLTDTTINETGNPGYVGAELADTPTLPQWGAILLGGLLMLLTAKHQRQHRA